MRGTTAPENDDRRMQLLPDGSVWGLVVSKTLYFHLSLISVFLTGFRYLSDYLATQLSSRGWVDTIPDPIFPEKKF